MGPRPDLAVVVPGSDPTLQPLTGAQSPRSSPELREQLRLTALQDAQAQLASLAHARPKSPRSPYAQLRPLDQAAPPATAQAPPCEEDSHRRGDPPQPHQPTMTAAASTTASSDRMSTPTEPQTAQQAPPKAPSYAGAAAQAAGEAADAGSSSSPRPSEGSQPDLVSAPGQIDNGTWTAALIRMEDRDHPNRRNTGR